MSVEEKSKEEVKTKKSEEKEQPTQPDTKSEHSSKESRKKNKSKLKTAEKIQSSRRNVDEKNEKKFKKSKSLRVEKVGTKEKDKEEEMPPTANSEKSQNQKKKKPKVTVASKTNPSATPIVSSNVSNSKGSIEDGKRRTVTPTPDVGPDKNSKAMGVIEPDAEAKKAIELLDQEKKKINKKKKELKRETNHIYHLRPGINKNAEHLRKKEFEKELIQFETGEFTYLTDPTRYRFRSTPPLELVIQFVFPSLLLLAVMLASVSCVIFLTKEYSLEMEFNEMSEVSLSKYDSYLVVESITEYLQSEQVLRENNCPGLIQGPWKQLHEHEFAFLKFESKRVKRAMKASTYRWIPQVEAVINMNFECPPSVLLEVK